MKQCVQLLHLLVLEYRNLPNIYSQNMKEEKQCSKHDECCWHQVSIWGCRVLKSIHGKSRMTLQFFEGSYEGHRSCPLVIIHP